MKSGIINVYKEKDYTSSDVVVILKKILQTKKVGHTGTLDPMAEGVLPICVGKATRLSDYIMDKDKVYEAEIVFGQATDTQDATGRVTEQNSRIVTQDELQAVLSRFLGEIDQIPPMYSAIKKNGKKLYEYAREGIVLERPPRKITIYSMEILKQKAPNVFLLRICCSKGTYIRVLCVDIAAALGTCGHMAALLRTACADFNLNGAFTIDKIRAMKDAENWSFLQPMDSAVLRFVRADVLPEYIEPFFHGRPIPIGKFVSADLTKGQKVRVYAGNEFCAMAEFNGAELKTCCMLRDT